MAVKLPRLCVSHTVRSDSASLGIGNTTLDFLTSDLAIGRYWTDPVYSTGLVASGSPCLLGAVAALIDAGSANVTGISKAYSSTSSPAWRASFAVDTAGDFRFKPSTTSDPAALEIMRRVGVDLANNSTQVIALGGSVVMPYALGIWDPDRGESGDTDEGWDGFGSVFRTVGGVVYTSDIGDALARRLISFNGLSGSYTRNRPSDGATRYGFEFIIWPFLARGEFVRYYADRSATTTYLTSAMTATSTGAVVASRTGFSTNDAICIDGEWMVVTGGTGTGAGTLTVNRPDAVAHSNYEPVSKDFVATYALDETEGDVNRAGFTPSRRAVNQDRWDFDISLIRTKP